MTLVGTPNPSLNEFAAFVEEFPKRLGLWRTASRSELYPLLAWLNVWTVQEFRETAAEVGPFMAAKGRHAELHNALGVGITWLFRYLREWTLGAGSEEMERRGFARRAAQVWSLRDLINSTRAGVYEFRAQGFSILFDFLPDPGLESLDNLLELVEEMEQGESLLAAILGDEGQGSSVSGSSLRSMLAEAGVNVPWEQAGEKLRQAFQQRAAVQLSSLRRVPIPESLSFGEFSLGEALAVWQELLSSAMYEQTCLLMGATHPFVGCRAQAPDELVSSLQGSGVSERGIEGVVDFLTFHPERDADPCLTPLIPIGNRIVPVSSLIYNSAPDRNLLAKLRSEPSRFGPFGVAVGDLGARVVGDAFKRVPGSRVATGVKVSDASGRTEGDLDVVIVDVADKLVAVFEVKWQLDPDGARKIDKVEDQVEAGQRQVRRLSRGIADRSLQASWPADWPDVSTFEWQWFVLTSNVIPAVRMTPGDVPARSHRMLVRIALRAGEPLRSVCDLFANPPVPEEGTHFVFEENVHPFGPYEVAVRRPS